MLCVRASPLTGKLESERERGVVWGDGEHGMVLGGGILGVAGGGEFLLSFMAVVV